MLLTGVLLTAFYTFRMLHMTFHGQFRGGVEQEMEDRSADAKLTTSLPAPAGAAHDSAGSGGVHLSESSVLMWLPMLVLGAAAVASGYLANLQWGEVFGIPGHWITHFLGSGLEEVVPSLADALEPPAFSWWLAAVSTGVALSGMALAGALYIHRPEGAGQKPREPLEAVKPVHTLLSHKYYIDALYEDAVVRRAFYRLFVGAADWLDRNLVDGVVDTIGWAFRNIGWAIGRLQTGQVQTYGAAVVFGSLLIMLWFLLS
jgi:NADH-quinone oxidoreductase subunit L